MLKKGLFPRTTTGGILRPTTLPHSRMSMHPQRRNLAPTFMAPSFRCRRFVPEVKPYDNQTPTATQNQPAGLCLHQKYNTNHPFSQRCKVWTKVALKECGLPLELINDIVDLVNSPVMHINHPFTPECKWWAKVALSTAGLPYELLYHIVDLVPFEGFLIQVPGIGWDNDWEFLQGLAAVVAKGEWERWEGVEVTLVTGYTAHGEWYGESLEYHDEIGAEEIQQITEGIPEGCITVVPV